MKGEKKMIKITGMPSKAKKALLEVLRARAFWETVKRIGLETKTEILSENVFEQEDTGERITNPNADFLMSEDDYERYLKMVYAKNCEKGIDSGGWDTTFWATQKAVYDAEDKFIDAIAADVPELTPEAVITIKTDLNQRKKFFAILKINV